VKEQVQLIGGEAEIWIVLQLNDRVPSKAGQTLGFLYLAACRAKWAISRVVSMGPAFSLVGT
jgi:hypothetical protein